MAGMTEGIMSVLSDRAPAESTLGSETVRRGWQRRGVARIVGSTDGGLGAIAVSVL